MNFSDVIVLRNKMDMYPINAAENGVLYVLPLTYTTMPKRFKRIYQEGILFLEHLCHSTAELSDDSKLYFLSSV